MGKKEWRDYFMTTYNFSAGPSSLPTEVMTQITQELTKNQATHMSILEISHRTPQFENILDEAKASLKSLLDLPDNYKVMFLSGGGTTQFEMVPMNLATRLKKIAILDSGNFAHKPIGAAEALNVTVDVPSTTRSIKYRELPHLPAQFDDTQYDYVHLVTNNTIEGTTYHQEDIPDVQHLVADMSSNILAEPYDFKKFDLIFAGAQKNLGIAGITLAIVNQDWLDEQDLSHLAPMQKYQTAIDKDSMYNTPPVFAIYVLNLVLKWIKQSGGIAGLYEKNQRKAHKLYDYLDHSSFFDAMVTGKERSLTNVVFTSGDATRDAQIAQKASQAGFYNLAGHRSVGGFRASLYNAQPEQAVDDLIAYLKNVEMEYLND